MAEYDTRGFPEYNLGASDQEATAAPENGQKHPQLPDAVATQTIRKALLASHPSDFEHHNQSYVATTRAQASRLAEHASTATRERRDPASPDYEPTRYSVAEELEAQGYFRPEAGTPKFSPTEGVIASHALRKVVEEQPETPKGQAALQTLEGLDRHIDPSRGQRPNIRGFHARPKPEGRLVRHFSRQRGGTLVLTR
ncbi:MAG TPA: hypothetical protein VMY99_00430 [Nevskiaceae bacterium]|nr:hypothetical protein [Nevskiaceae bacterium]